MAVLDSLESFARLLYGRFKRLLILLKETGDKTQVPRQGTHILNESSLSNDTDTFGTIKKIMFFGNPPNWEGKHCLVTGGSQGLGKEVARLLLAEGCHVTILARNKTKLENAVKELSDSRGKVHFVSADVTNYADIVQAVDKSISQMDGLPVSLLFCCAGSAQPGIFLEQKSEDFDWGMKTNYLGSLYTVHAVAKTMVAKGVRGGKVVLVGSTLSLIGIAGYSQYAPAKAALRNLADCLRQEFLSYGIGVHIYCPGNIDTPGFAEEQKIKPEMTKTIEGTVALLKPEECASILLSKLKRNQFIITSDFDTNLLRCSMLGISPKNNYVLDSIYQSIANVKYALLISTTLKERFVF